MHRIQKQVGFFLVICFIISCGLPHYSECNEGIEFSVDSQLTTEILDLFRTSISLDERIEKYLSEWKLRPSNRQLNIGGQRKKYLLEDKHGKQWLLKIPCENFDESLTISRVTANLFTLCGIEIPHPYLYNYLGQKGTIEIFVKDAENLDDFDLALLSIKNLEYLSYVQVVDWLVSDLDRHKGDFIVNQKTGKLYGLDLEGSFDEINLNTLTEKSASWIYNSLRNEYILGNIKISFSSPQGLIGFISSLNDSIFVELFSKVEKSSQGLSNELILKSILTKKHFLYKEFKAYYHNIAESVAQVDEFNEKWSGTFISQNTKRLQIRIIKFLKKRIKDQKKFLKGQVIDFL